MIHLVDESGSESWAEVCETLYLERRDDVSFYLDQSNRSGGPVLEIGCATGRITEILSDFGKDVYAIDPSAPQLEIARTKVNALDNPGDVTFTLSTLDKPDISSGKKYGLAIVPCYGFMSITDPTEQQRFLHNIRRNLSPGGRLVIEMEVPDPGVMLGDPATLYHYRDVNLRDESSVVLYSQRDYEDHSQIGYVKAVAEFLDSTGLVTKKVVHDLEFRYTFRWEMHHLLRLCGFEVLSLYGDFDEGPFTEESDQMVWVAGSRS